MARSETYRAFREFLDPRLEVLLGVYTLGLVGYELSTGPEAPPSGKATLAALAVAATVAAADGAHRIFSSPLGRLGPMERPEGKPHDPPRGHRPPPLLREDSAA